MWPIPKREESRYTTRQIVRWLWHIMKGNRRQALLNSGVGLAATALSLATVWAMHNAIDIAAHTRGGSLTLAVALMAVLTLGEFALGMARVWIRNILGVKAQNRMQQTILDRMLRAEWQGVEKMHSGDATNRIERDVATVTTFITETLPGTLAVAALFAGAFAYLLRMDALLAVVTVAILPVFILSSRAWAGRMRTLTRKVRGSDSRIQSIIQESLQNRLLIKTLECGTSVVRRLDTTQSELRDNVRRRTAFSLMSNLVLNLGFSLGYLIAFGWSAYRLSEGSLSFGAMAAFMQLVYRIQNPARELTRLAPAFVGVATAAERLMELEETPEEECDGAIAMPQPCGIALDNVTFAYADGDGGATVLEHLTFDFRPGTCTAITGATGRGKTTLIRLLLALVRPTEGTIRLYGGEAEADVSPQTRCNFVYVPQGNTLMSGTIRDNLLLADGNATDSDLRRVLRMACADFVDDLPDGLDTMTSEKGGRLSEGQAQRITVARALLRNRGIMLFDEATSALDPATEREMLRNILSANDKTVIFITHRNAVLDFCDSVLEL